MFYKIKKDIEYIMENDPAARTKLEVFLLYPSIHARLAHMISHFLYKKNLLFLARLISQIARFLTGSIGIVITIPIATYLSTRTLKRMCN